MLDPERRRQRHLDAAVGYLTLQMPDHALAELRAVDDPDADARVFYQLRAEAYRMKRLHAEALQDYERALQEAPDDPTLMLGMAWCYKRTGQLGKAIAITEAAYRIAPDKPLIMYNLACYLALAGDRERALAWLGRALRRDQSYRKLVAEEPDFDGLRADPDFRRIVGERFAGPIRHKE
ncbi:MAG: hypothetical protein D6725_08690 [Planctomycetota bacterium]|nr:MAG: hypothetical protein D6725_08690 [Planctomycetota bacterium]